MSDRIVRDELLTSERYWRCSPEARNLFLSIILTVDDAARMSGSNFTLRTKCMAATIGPERVDAILAELVDCDLVRRYIVDGAPYLFIPRFKNRRRYISGSKFPAPPAEIDDTLDLPVPDVSEQDWRRLRKDVVERDGACVRCGDTDRLHAHHVTPRSRGGLSVLENLIALCQSCNSWAKDNDPRCNEIKDLIEKKASHGTPAGIPEAPQGHPEGNLGPRGVGVGVGVGGKATPSAPSEKISLDAAEGWQGITPQHRILWRKAYPAISIDIELSKAQAWIAANPKNTKQNYERFLTNWFSRAQDRAPALGGGTGPRKVAL